MKKEYLDRLYESRSKAQSEIDMLTQRRNAPRAQCCENMPDQDENMARLDEVRNRLQLINQLIKMYLVIHGSSK